MDSQPSDNPSPHREIKSKQKGKPTQPPHLPNSNASAQEDAGNHRDSFKSTSNSFTKLFSSLSRKSSQSMTSCVSDQKHNIDVGSSKSDDLNISAMMPDGDLPRPPSSLIEEIVPEYRTIGFMPSPPSESGEGCIHY